MTQPQIAVCPAQIRETMVPAGSLNGRNRIFHSVTSDFRASASEIAYLVGGTCCDPELRAGSPFSLIQHGCGVSIVYRRPCFRGFVALLAGKLAQPQADGVGLCPLWSQVGCDQPASVALRDGRDAFPGRDQGGSLYSRNV